MEQRFVLGLENVANIDTDTALEPIVTLKGEDKTKRQIVITFEFPGFRLVSKTVKIGNEERLFQELDIPKIGFYAKTSGYPLLPSLGRYVQIPFNCKLEAAGGDFAALIKVDHGKETILSDKLCDREIFPAQDMSDGGIPENLIFRYKEDFYKNSNQWYPEKLLDVMGPVEIDGYNALLLHVTPFQYNPVQKKLIGYHQIKVTIDVSPRLLPNGNQQEAPYYLSETAFSREAFGNFFLNPQRGIELRLGHTVSTDPEPAKTTPEFLIIYHSDFQEAAEKLALWKQQRGMVVETISSASVFTSQSVSEDDSDATKTEAIKQHILSLRRGRSSRLRYVLLVGDVGQIPASKTYPNNYITDYYYATADEDSESTTANSPDKPLKLVLPRLALGRIPVNNSNEAELVVEKIIQYEQHPSADTNYYRRMAFASVFQDSDKNNREDWAHVKTVEAVCRRMESLRFDVQRIYVSGNEELKKWGQYLANIEDVVSNIGKKSFSTLTDLVEFAKKNNNSVKIKTIIGKDPVPSFKYIDETDVPPRVVKNIVSDGKATSAIQKAIKNGLLIMSHRGHGSPSQLEGPELNRQHLEEIETGLSETELFRPSIFYSINCHTGRFNILSQEDGFAEVLLKMKSGAPTLIAATRNTNTWLNNYLFTGLFDATWAGIIPTFPSGVGSYPMKHSRMGDILEYAKLYITVKSNGERSVIQQYLDQFHLLGDPTLEIWRARPHSIKFRVLREGNNLSITLLTSNYRPLSACPAESVLTIWKQTPSNKRELFKRITPQVPHFTVSIRELLQSQPNQAQNSFVISICFWAPGYRFYQEEWQGTPQGRLRRKRK